MYINLVTLLIKISSQAFQCIEANSLGFLVFHFPAFRFNLFQLEKS